MGTAQSSSVGDAPSTEEATRVVSEWLLHSAVQTQHDTLLPDAVARLLRTGAVSEAVQSWAQQNRQLKHSEPPQDEQDAGGLLAPSLLLLDPALAIARSQCVPSRVSERVWWALCVHALRNVATAQLPQLLAQERAHRALRELALLSPQGGGKLSKLPAPALERIAAALPAASVLDLAATCKPLFALGYVESVWRAQAARDFPDVVPAGRARYEEVARGGHSVPPGTLEAVHAFLSSSWGTAEYVYGGWGSPHLEVAMLWRTPAGAAVRAEFEFKFDDGETVWGDRVREELRLVPGGGHHGGAVASWAAVYRRGRPIVVEPLHGSLRGPPREETQQMSMELEMTAVSDVELPSRFDVDDFV